MYLLLPFLAAFVFALGAMVFKRAYSEGARVAHVLVVNNAILGLLFLPLTFLQPGPIPWESAARPLLTGTVFALGHLFNVLALKAGDVSVATPVLGAKVIFVGLAGLLLFGFRLSPELWLATALATLGVIVMGLTDLKPGRRQGMTTLLSLGSAAAFAVTDVLTQHWGKEFGTFHFLPLQFGALALVSLVLLPVFGGTQALRAPATAWKWILFGAALSGTQAILITGTIAVWQDAAGVNVVYATRGLWGVALVWFIGHRLKNHERHSAGSRAMAARAIGASLLLIAVAATAWNTWRRA